MADEVYRMILKEVEKAEIPVLNYLPTHVYK